MDYMAKKIPSRTPGPAARESEDASTIENYWGNPSASTVFLRNHFGFRGSVWNTQQFHHARNTASHSGGRFPFSVRPEGLWSKGIADDPDMMSRGPLPIMSSNRGHPCFVYVEYTYRKTYDQSWAKQRSLPSSPASRVLSRSFS